MSQPVTITLELVDREILTANDRHGHWGSQSTRTHTIRAKAAGAWMRAGRPQLDRAHCTVWVTYPSTKPPVRDVHNLGPTFKAAIDGMVHPRKGVRGLLPDDNDRYLVGPDPRVHEDRILIAPGRYPRTRFAFTFVEPPVEPLVEIYGHQLAAEFIHGTDDAMVLPEGITQTAVTAAAGYAALYLTAGGEEAPLAGRARHVLDTCIRLGVFHG